ncbi:MULTISPECIES: ribose 5-phosphate isomerase B [Caproicibacterium]|uniref:Ribose 5-phosphate isomerase B n=1 Tax=Caproicibacterium lactatifermentans TaxID=2666138 RepID=A0A859DRC7_9FIRM|nr:ribose 5-phosphate isomerase B [Caproicibacterium lactatifermentans]ARP50025.1 ribose 5-phosphate isomerase B [Ruminococcaceae bacterium CPB6]MDD4808105.1 ribose 5-phosphate isomerase B [Oscillospiraceae bacterium]QKN24194.1 ribose 5-phosphate isomerase B [Caproicibacterium lactatifermentans]QKO30737.1 ribose 5-phosphate isomerase B [Caproicibacterium lactatifermentans]
MLAIGCDHGGFQLKKEIEAYLESRKIEYRDFGTDSEESVDYPLFAAKVAHSVADGTCDRAILCCGTGIGMSIAANKVHGIRAAVVTEPYGTEFTRRHNNCNCLCLGGRVLTTEKALELVRIYLDTPFEGGRHQRRIDEIAKIENGEL